MKKIAWTGIVLLFAVTMNAQSFGFKIGANLSGINSNMLDIDSLTDQLKPGLTGGLVFEYNPAKHFGIRAEAIFSQKGYKINAESTLDTTDIVTDISVNINYIESRHHRGHGRKHHRAQHSWVRIHLHHQDTRGRAEA